MEAAITNTGITSNALATEKEYPITTLWLFKPVIIMVLISVVLLFFGYWVPYFAIAIPYFLIANPLIRSRFHYFVTDKYFVVQQGVFSKKERNLPYSVIQNVFVKQDLFDRVFGLASLTVENASSDKKKGFWSLSMSDNRRSEVVGATGNKVSIPGLKKASAEALKMVLLERIKANPHADMQSGL